MKFFGVLLSRLEGGVVQCTDSSSRKLIILKFKNGWKIKGVVQRVLWMSYAKHLG